MNMWSEVLHGAPRRGSVWQMRQNALCAYSAHWERVSFACGTAGKYAPRPCTDTAAAPAARRLPEALAAPLSALRKAARQVGTAAADAKLGINVDEFVERFR
jgi:hypothetical protein